MNNIHGFSGMTYFEVIEKIKKWQNEFADTTSLKPGTVEMYPKITYIEHYTIGHTSRLTGSWTEHFMTVVYDLSRKPEVIMELESQITQKDSKPKIKAKKTPHSKHSSAPYQSCN